MNPVGPEWTPRTLGPGAQDRWQSAVSLGFGHTKPLYDFGVDDIERLGRRAWAVEDLGRIVGTSGDVTWDLTLPGGAAVPVGAILSVTTRPTHRRRGVLNALMSAQLGAMVSEGQAAAVLTASEGGIYGRFGFGVATVQHRLEAPTGGHGLDHVPPGRIDLEVASVFRGEMKEFRQQVARHRPGTLSRPDFWWDRFVLGEHRSFEGGGSQFASLHRNDDGEVDGYALWRRTGEWGEQCVEIRELHTLDPLVELALFRHCAEIDLTATVVWPTAPPDTPIPAATSDPRRCRVAGHRDQLWLCPLDVPALLAVRTYSAPLDVVLEIGGLRGVDGASQRLRLSADGSGAVDVTEAPSDPSGRPQLSCDRATLGMAILGTTPWRTLVAAGRARVSHSDLIPALDAAFAAHPAAGSQDYF